MKELIETRERLRELLKGQVGMAPWRVEDSYGMSDALDLYATFHNSIVRSGDTFRLTQRSPLNGGREFSDATTELIVAAVNALPALLDRIDTLESAVQSARNEALEAVFEHKWEVNSKMETRCSCGKFDSLVDNMAWSEHVRRALKTDGTQRKQQKEL